jgi:serine/threonine protein kinase
MRPTPQALRGESYTQASDVYSLALVLWEIISGKIPFHDTMSSLPPLPPTPLFSTITKNLSFQSLTGYDSTHGNHGHSRQSIDNKKSSRISTRQQVLGGSRPEIPPCPPEYAEIIRMGWSVDRYRRPSAAGLSVTLYHLDQILVELVTELEKILSRYFPSNLNIIEVQQQHSISSESNISFPPLFSFFTGIVGCVSAG